MSLVKQTYDVIVVGAGHAGSEAAYAAARMGSKTLLITMNLQNIAQMSCNPAMGGVAKGQILREIDALGGGSAMVSDRSAIQFRMLNRSKGPAMWSPRTQNDRMRFAEEWRLQLERTEGLDFYQDMVVDLLVDQGTIKGVKTGLGEKIYGRKVVVTAGTFLNGVIHVGEQQFGGGRAGERASIGITERLIQLGFKSGRMKTGTPPRVDGRSLNYEKMEEQAGDSEPAKFSFDNCTEPLVEQRSCHITYTNPAVHEALKEGFDRSPMFNGAIESIGPRYCPSIEDKIYKFADKDRHQIFVEPEGWQTVEVYVNGFSTSLPYEVQAKAIRLIPGFEEAKIFRPGYAIEYDYFPPLQLKYSLETKLVEGLYFAGQINGTTGYEEAACQGLIAGINASLACADQDPLVLGREEAYIGVLIDDLITKGTEEPYRMFTSRAEHRILLRQDNADERLSPTGHQLGLISQERMEALEHKTSRIKELNDFIAKTSVEPDEVNPVLKEKNTAPIKQKLKLARILARPQIVFKDLMMLETLRNYVANNRLSVNEIEGVEIAMKYSGYIEKEKENAEKLNRLEGLRIPGNLDYSQLQSMSYEAREKLAAHKPESIREAKAISGVSPADISVLLVYMGR